MTRVRLIASLWAVFAFVTWNVVFDRRVNLAAEEFTREQIVRHQNGRATLSIHDGFSPQVRVAAWQATLWVTPIVAVGAVMTFVSYRRIR